MKWHISPFPLFQLAIEETVHANATACLIVSFTARLFSLIFHEKSISVKPHLLNNSYINTKSVAFDSEKCSNKLSNVSDVK